MTPEQERAYKIGIEALESYRTEPYGDLRLNAARASAKVVMALGGGGLVIVDGEDLDVALSYACRDQDGAESPAIACLRSALVGTAPQPSVPLHDAQTSGDGMTGPIDNEKPTGTLSAPQGWTGFTDAHGRHFLRQVADNGDLLIAFRPTPIEEDWNARAEEAEEALEAAQQALAHPRYARALNESSPVTADRIAEAILGPGDYAEGAALAALTKEKTDGS